MLIAINNRSGRLVSWPINPGGGNHPTTLSGPLGVNGSGMAANGHLVVAASQYPPGVVTYNVQTKQEVTLADPFGVPIDVAIDKNSAIYILNVGTPTGIDNVTKYPGGSPHPRKLVCKFLKSGQAIAVDNEGDIFVNGYGHTGGAGVVEIPSGPNGPEPQNCTRLHLKAEPGYVAGLAIDPKTDDLIVLDDPDDCAGGIEGRMTIYPKPYEIATSVTHDLGANCAGWIRLNASSDIVFVGDEDVSGSFSFILQRSYPEGRGMGIYQGGNPDGFTTIPNTLPN